MSELITISVGGCGLNVGISFWEQLVDRKAKQPANSHKVYYERLFDIDKKGKQTPRALFVDTDIRSNILASSSQVGFNTNRILGYGDSCNNIFAQGWIGAGFQQIQAFHEAIRQETEKCDSLSGFIMIRSSQGGVGSGLGALIASHIRSRYSYYVLEEIKIMEGIDSKTQNINLTPLKVYNTVLSHCAEINDFDMHTIFENSAIIRILEDRKIKPTYKQINKYIGHCLNQHISAYIEGGDLNMSQRKRLVNLLPFPGLKHICGGLSQPNSQDHIVSSLEEKNRTINFDRPEKQCNIYSLNINVRDNKMTEKEVNQSVNSWKKASNCQFINWIDSYNISLLNNDFKNEQSTWTLCNGSVIVKKFQKISEMYKKLNKRKAFQHHYSAKFDEIKFVYSQNDFDSFLSQQNSYKNNQDDQNSEYQQ